MRDYKSTGVLMVIGSFFPEITGGGLQALSLMNALKEEVRFYVITTAKDRRLLVEDSLNGIKVFRVLSGSSGFFWKIRAFVRFFVIFFRIRKDVGIIHLHGFSQKTVMFIILARIFGKKIVAKTSSLGKDDPVSIKNQRFGLFKFFFYSKCDSFISICPAISKRFENVGLGKRKLFFIPNGVDTERFKPLDNDEQKRALKSELGLDPDLKMILYVGFFSYDKDPELLWKTYCSLTPDLVQGTQLLFLGSNNTGYFEISSKLIKYIKDDVTKNNMTDRVLFVDKTLIPEKYYQASDIFVLSSKREGLPNVLLEAMACGVPSIASRINGITDYIVNDGKDGLLFEPGNRNELRDKLSMLLRDRAYSWKLGSNAREKIKKICNMGLISRRYMEMYRGL